MSQSQPVNLDHYVKLTHDFGRGEGNFTKALFGFKMLFDMDFNASVARHILPNEDDKVTEKDFKELFIENGLSEDLHMVAFPDFALPGSLSDVPYVTMNCMTEFQNQQSRKQFMCAFSRMMVKRVENN